MAADYTHLVRKCSGYYAGYLRIGRLRRKIKSCQVADLPNNICKAVIGYSTIVYYHGVYTFIYITLAVTGNARQECQHRATLLWAAENGHEAVVKPRMPTSKLGTRYDGIMDGGIQGWPVIVTVILNFYIPQ
jgi:hypothetical protein